MPKFLARVWGFHDGVLEKIVVEAENREEALLKVKSQINPKQFVWDIEVAV